ncbi:MAG: MAPEG family protein [Pseudomonadaceae bacterium]|uniref:MAPEG family protein n=1 Tax=Pseudomonas sp. Ga0074129 TaxID=1752219 RepID=UPI000A948197|nr:MAPEG family protein [Pseudomonas sp. Ga0074129]MBX9764823.1 MAPEG family protein [Pseudomonadaceae bacterium]
MTLTATAMALLGLVAWPLLLMFLMINQRGLLVLSGKMAVNAFNPDGSNTPGELAKRLVRVHANCLENLPLQAALLLYAIASAQTAVTEPLALALLGARLAQGVVHLISTRPLFVWLRFAAFFVQLAILAWWLLQFAGLAG